ncbi:hypothetical protein B0T17DRAFT_611758 [Bombardia bombarda]|uniref:Uncharacterized protein n=1 Tax=Bombardia bombarda TaxID=252184 RepID=A0AA39XIU3_9PEZI|nr:hypothetical protein B0T17DRAFT_611758 [Bombardia bombarda]
MSVPANIELIHAYRHLLRWGLRAVQFSKPSRYVIRDQLRDAFRDDITKGGVTAKFDRDGIRRTIWFLKGAAESPRGRWERKILKNLCRVAWERKFAVTRARWRVLVIHNKTKEISKKMQRL